MKRHLISRYALLAAIAAGLVALGVAGLFVRREWQAARALKSAPAAVAKSIEQQSLEFTFSKVSGQQTVFTIHAARATEYEGRQRRLLEDVDIVVHGNQGERDDHIRTHACEYRPEPGRIVCEGAVQLDLERAAGASGNGLMQEGGIHIQTRRLGFNAQTGEASTDAVVAFQFPNGRGSAVGVTYFSRKPELKLGHNVHLTLTADRAGEAPTQVSAEGMEYDRKSGQLVLSGPVRIEKGDRTVETTGLTVSLNRQLQPVRAQSAGPATVSVSGGARQASAQAGAIAILFDEHGRAERLEGSGGVLARELAPGAMKLVTKEMAIALNPANQYPKQAWANGDVDLDSRNAGRRARVKTQALELTFAESPKQEGAAKRLDSVVELRAAASPGPASVEWESNNEELRLEAGRLNAVFSGINEVQGLKGDEGVHLSRRIQGSPTVTSSAERLQVHFADGQWTEAEETGNVRAVQGERQASAERARWTRADDTLALTGQARVSDASAQTLADTIVWNQKTSRLEASGLVRSTYLTGQQSDSGTGSNAGPANVVADSLQANTKTSDAVYSGNARLWQGDLVIQADIITMHRVQGRLVAEGNVVAAIPQTSSSRTMRVGYGEPSSKPRGAARPTLWRIRARELTYQSAPARGKDADGGQVTLQGEAEATSDQGTLRAQRLVLTLKRNGAGRAEVAHAAGEGGVTIRQGDRWGQAPQGEYDAANGKFVLWGGKASLHDTSGDLVSGTRLTFYVADDTILVESSEGTRTLTLHPVPK